MLSYRPFRLEITVPLHLETFHVGTGQQLSLSTDSPILRDEHGSPYVPASSLRGVIRAHLEREAPLLGCDPGNIADLFGETPLSRSTNQTSSFGRLQVSDARLIDCKKYDTEIRDHVRVDPKTGAAANKAKFDAEAATGTHELRCTLVYEGESDSDGELLLLQEALRALENRELHCGAKSGWGYGRLQAHKIEYRAFNRSDPGGLAAFCAQRLGRPATPQTFVWPQAKPARPNDPALPAWSWIDFDLELGFEGPVLVRAPIPPGGGNIPPLDARKPELYPQKGLVTADHVFITTGTRGLYYLPGSSLRGVLRSQAHRIANTMARVQPFDTLFGRINAKDDTGQKSLVEVGDGSLIGTAQPVYLDHVAIDRITGFAADSKKFSTCALQSPRFQVRLRVRLTQRDLASLALFAFVFRDLCDGWLWVGGGVTRGFGHLKQVKATSMTLNCTSDFAVPPGFHSTAQTPARGRTRLTVPGPLDFYSMNWLWEQAEQAWKANPSQEGAA